ncbi:MAG: hypothetical protein CMH23_02705 [Methylophaga sp.]|jgi:hypothetical protein|uniref:hypothetical protein n=1 Tax=Methylophaga sp. TaxID=2024840 RepID=UPI000C8F02BD|nr:hypothetical protein [Methylophaga sp.]MBN45363.1 hypothetical protein [Methylophaga sp.]|tara:strand:+ start:61177 stop:61863 length:687 start_codon:yes stop_codon:yes gene_type:complete
MDSFVVTLLVIMLPGIIAVVIADKVVSHAKWTSFKYAMYSYLFGVSSYALLQSFYWFFDILRYFYSSIFSTITPQYLSFSSLSTWSAVTSETPLIAAEEVIAAMAISILIAYSSAWLINYKLFNKIAKKLSISNKYGDESLYSFFLNADGFKWVYVRDREAELTYQGRILSYSGTESFQELVLSKVTVYRYSDSAFLYSVPGIYLVKEMGKFVIEVVPKEFLGETDES